MKNFYDGSVRDEKRVTGRDSLTNCGKNDVVASLLAEELNPILLFQTGGKLRLLPLVLIMKTLPEVAASLAAVAGHTALFTKVLRDVCPIQAEPKDYDPAA